MTSPKPIVPADATPIRMTAAGILEVPDRPIVPFIEGDGTGPDIWRAAVRVLDAAVEKEFGGGKKIAWTEVYAGEKAKRLFDTWLPDETLEAFKTYLVGIKGPLTTPVGGGIRSLNVAIRQMLDLYVCLRPVRYFNGVPSPVKMPEKVDMVIFRENTEDIYAGVEWPAGSAEAQKLIGFLQNEMGVNKIRFPDSSGIGVKPVSREGSERLIRAAFDYALLHQRRSVTLVHKGNIMKFTEGAFRDWGYALAKREYAGRIVAWDDCGGRPEPGQVLLKDAIADIALQQVLTRPEEFDVIATLNLNGDYLSDALAAQVGGIGIAPGGNINYLTGHAVFEATHGTAPKYANLDKVNPGSVLLSGVMLLEHLAGPERPAASSGRWRKPSARKPSPTTSPASWRARPRYPARNSATASSPIFESRRAAAGSEPAPRFDFLLGDETRKRGFRRGRQLDETAADARPLAAGRPNVAHLQRAFDLARAAQVELAILEHLAGSENMADILVQHQVHPAHAHFVDEHRHGPHIGQRHGARSLRLRLDPKTASRLEVLDRRRNADGKRRRSLELADLQHLGNKRHVHPAHAAVEGHGAALPDQLVDRIVAGAVHHDGVVLRIHLKQQRGEIHLPLAQGGVDHPLVFYHLTNELNNLQL